MSDLKLTTTKKIGSEVIYSLDDESDLEFDFRGQLEWQLI